jgi:hypothetical protein
MHIKDLIPEASFVQSNYCDDCGKLLDLEFSRYDEEISSVHIQIDGLPVLRCSPCSKDHLPDLSRLALIDCHKRAVEAGSPVFACVRKKRTQEFKLAKVPFLYDPDDYFYIPGLHRPFDVGFLTPVFFNREVLLKYDNSPSYRVQFASTTYGTIYTGVEYISFGINKNGLLVMWLGDIAKMPETEQYYLRSENVPSDHSIGSEFYEGQIECVFTEAAREDRLFKARSAFIEANVKRFGKKIAHLDDEVVSLAFTFNGPVVDSEKERRHVADTLNKIYIESFDNAALGDVLKSLGGDPKNLGSLKRLQGILEVELPKEDINSLLSPLYVLYDLRVAYSHLISTERQYDVFKTVVDRLGLDAGVTLTDLYGRLIEALIATFERLAELIDIDDAE